VGWGGWVGGREGGGLVDIGWHAFGGPPAIWQVFLKIREGEGMDREAEKLRKALEELLAVGRGRGARIRYNKA